MSRQLMTPFTVGFGVALIPAAWIFFSSYKSPEDRLKDLQKNGYSPTARLPTANSGVNQQLLASIFKNRNEPDLYTALGETNRKAPAVVAAEVGVVPVIDDPLALFSAKLPPPSPKTTSASASPARPSTAPS